MYLVCARLDLSPPLNRKSSRELLLDLLLPVLVTVHSSGQGESKRTVFTRVYVCT